LRDQQSGQSEVIGQKNQTARFGAVVETDSSQFIRIFFGSVEAVEGNNLVTAQAGACIDRVGMQSAITHSVLGPDDKPGPCALNRVKARVIHIAAIHQVEGAGLIVNASNHVTSCVLQG